MIERGVAFRIPFINVNTSFFQKYLHNIFLSVTTRIEKYQVIIHIAVY